MMALHNSRRYPRTITRRAIVLGLAAMAAAPAFAQSPSAASLMTASYEASRFRSVRFHAVLTITGSSGGQRVRELAGVSKILGAEEATARLMRISAPPDMRGVGTLTVAHKTVADDLWVYLPSLRRVRRLVSSNRRDPWMGSDFSYGDVAGHEVADWNHSIVRRETVQKQRCIVIESTPTGKATSSETGYSRRLTWLREPDSF